MDMINLQAVTKRFNPGEPNEVRAISGLDLIVAEGDFMVVIGANGSGKSTLLNLFSGAVFPSSGRISIDGKDVSRLAEHQRSKWIARVFQDPLKGTAAELSILDNFRMAALRTSAKKPVIGLSAAFRKQVQEQVAQLGMGIENALDRPMGSLSGGQRQALTLMMCVMDDLKILLLDEPTAALDPRSAALLMKMADKLVTDRQLTAVLVTHQLKDAFRYGNRLLFMEEGEVKRDLDKTQKARLTETELYSWFM